jgi:hypothetical protein
MSACVGARLPVALGGEQVTIFGPRGTRVWTRGAGDSAPGRPFRAQRSGVFRTVYRGRDGVRRFETMVVRCESRPTLTLSNGRAPILRLENARPSAGDTGCVIVSYAGRSAASVRLYGRTIGTGLDRHMTLTITRGTMPISSSGSCRSFAPDSTNYLGAGTGVVFRGTLRRFADSASEGYADPTPASPELWQPGESHAYKLVVALAAANAAQGLRAEQTFTWTAKTPSIEVDGNGDTSGGGSGSSDSSSLRDALARMLSELAPTALAVAEASAFPLLLLLLVLAFLIVQDRIDRRDPKLALAPVYPEPDLPFLPPSVRGEAA